MFLNTRFNDNGVPMPATVGSIWDVKNVTTFANMFNGDTSINVSMGTSAATGWTLGTNKSNVLLTSMFQGATSFNQDIHFWNVSRVTNMVSMFAGAIPVSSAAGAAGVVTYTLPASNTTAGLYVGESITISGASPAGYSGVFTIASVPTTTTFTVTNATTGASSGTIIATIGAVPFNQDISAWSTSLVTTMAGIFNGAAENQNLGAWNMTGIAVGGLLLWESGFHVLPYSQTLSGWATEALPTRAIVASVVTTNYNTYNIAGKAARTKLGTFSWTFSGDGTLAIVSPVTVSSATPAIGSVVTFTATVTGSSFADANGIGYPNFNSFASIPVTTITGTGSLATFTVASTAGLTTGQTVTISGATATTGVYNTSGTITVLANGTQFTMALTGTGTTSGTAVVSPLWVITGTAGATSCNSALGGTQNSPPTSSTYTCSINVVNGGTYLAAFTYPGDPNYVTATGNSTASAAKVNPTSVTVSPNVYAVTATSGNGSLATFTVATTVGMTQGQAVVISGSTVAAYNGSYTINTIPTGTTFTVVNTTASGASSGTIATLTTPAATIGTPVVFTAIVTGATNGATPGGTVSWVVSGTGGTGNGGVAKACTSTGPFGFVLLLRQKLAVMVFNLLISRLETVTTMV
jgi:surface protein